ncbi:MAG: galactokinase [Chloroflexota bacterium]|nr:galactokinase [Chloroflexota bacterium]
MLNNANLPAPAREAVVKFPIAFKDEVSYTGPLGAAWAPGRVNLIGEHTDYNDGFVLPLAVDRVAVFAGRARGDGMVRLWSEQFTEYAYFSLASLPTTFEMQRDALPGWARYVLGVVTELKRAGAVLAGFDAVLSGDVPLGGGMSSSAALEVATAQASALFSSGRFTIGAQGAILTPMEVARACQQAEQIASGVRCGILDQAASCLGRPGHAVLLDCRSLAYRSLPFEAPGLSLVVIDTGVRRDLATSAYNERRQQCEEATRMLREFIASAEPDNEATRHISALRDITPEQFERYGGQLPDLLRRRAGYVIAEDQRVLRVVELLERGEVEAVGPYLWQSHAGLRDDYEVSSLELDTLVEIARQVPGVLGARMMGGGFGGCTINLVRADAVEPLRQVVQQRYPEQTNREASIDVCRAAGGPGNAWIASGGL